MVPIAVSSFQATKSTKIAIHSARAQGVIDERRRYTGPKSPGEALAAAGRKVEEKVTGETHHRDKTSDRESRASQRRVQDWDDGGRYLDGNRFGRETARRWSEEGMPAVKMIEDGAGSRRRRESLAGRGGDRRLMIEDGRTAAGRRF